MVTGRGQSLRAAQAAVRYDETRLFLVAVSRATERLLVTAVRNEDEQPSVYLDIVDPPEEDDASDELRPFTEVDRAMTLSALVAELRREVVNAATASEREAAARDLARLAAERVPGADPASWWALTAAQRRPPAATRGVDGLGVTVPDRRLRRLQPALAAVRVRRRGAERGRRQHRHAGPRHRRRAG